MTTQPMAATGQPDVEMPNGMMEMLCKHFFGLEAYEPVGGDAVQEAWMSQLVEWTVKVLGCDRKVDERRPFKVDMAHAVFAAQEAGTKMNPYECQFKLSPVVVAVNEALASLREGKEKEASIAEKRQHVCKQGENMIHQLKGKLERGEITEQEMLSKSKVVVQWQSKKDSELDVALGDMESEICGKVENACNFILDAWKAIAAPACSLLTIPEKEDDILMELEMVLNGTSEKDQLGFNQLCHRSESLERFLKELIQQPLQEQLQTDKQNNDQAPVAAVPATEDKPNNGQTQTNGSVPLAAAPTPEDKQNNDQTQTDGSVPLAAAPTPEDKQNSHQTQTNGSANEDPKVAKQQLHEAAVVEAQSLQRRAGGNGSVNRAIDSGLVDDVLKHPDKYNVQETKEHELVRVWESAKITSSSKNSTEATIRAEMDLTAQQTRELLPVAMQLGNLPDGPSSSRLPTPAGLMTRGSAEDLAKEAEEYKKLRKAGKGGFAQQVKGKCKIGEGKLEELAGLKAQLAAKPAHMSEPLQVGYTAELELHSKSLTEAMEILKADDLAEDLPEKQQAQQAAVDAFNDKVKAYTDAASMIKKKLAKAKAKGKAKGKAKAKAAKCLSQSDVGPLCRHVLKCTGKGDLSFCAAAEMLRHGHKVPMSWVRVPMRTSFTDATVVYRHSQPLFKPKCLRGQNGEVELAAKAYNARVIISWLGDLVTELIHTDESYQTEATQELAYFARINYRFYHTFISEDMNGRLVSIASRAHSRALERSTLQRYYLWLVADHDESDDEMGGN
ncbi:hypothetical protein AK812_SmicGene23619 [Symbiodinium microadriaticum]|uniref:Uncharacterized protein n=1 Tax=Symbiodinium microadriaticum TaxID=2951 RepID=A0A1Q9DGN4_SYMMI|nr:hypothetical protein AK812_SmicGene23619 [Symbiodinium microadriaticum]